MGVSRTVPSFSIAAEIEQTNGNNLDHYWSIISNSSGAITKAVVLIFFKSNYQTGKCMYLYRIFLEYFRARVEVITQIVIDSAWGRLKPSFLIYYFAY